MKWFLYSLIVFCLLMCSCKTQTLDLNVKERTDIQSELSLQNESVKINTQNHTYFANEAQRVVIEEDIVVTEYDKESGKPTKETKTKRKTTQDTEKASTEKENQTVTDCNQLVVEHNADISKKIDSEIKEESIGGQEAFGKWFGIVIGVIVGLLLLYLMRKLRIN
jgi:tetrahydromethanopterin S-methyltransferase subunit G